MRKLVLIALAAAAALAATAADAKTVTQPCRKDLNTGFYAYDSAKFSEDYIITVLHFQETSHDGRYAYGVCTINLKYQPAD